jgi:hypothetical protein
VSSGNLVLEPLIRPLRQTTVRLWLLYFIVYVVGGGTLQLAAPYLRIAAFLHNWQVFSLYGLFLVPLSILLRGRPWHSQYAYSVVAIAPVDIVGFAIGTSVAYPGNLIERIVGPRSFTLTFVVIAGWIPVAGNIVVSWFEGLLFERKPSYCAGTTVFDGQALPPLQPIDAGAIDREGPLPPAWQ